MITILKLLFYILMGFITLGFIEFCILVLIGYIRGRIKNELYRH